MKPTIIIRHTKENKKKCSLTPLEKRADMLFFEYPLKAPLPQLEDYILLDLDGEELSKSDSNKGLLILDGTWRYAKKMREAIPALSRCLVRKIPGHYRTAYPRKQTDCFDPERGLASLEAIYIAYHLMGRSTAGLLDAYYWRQQFLMQFV